mgnify:CR=1 FL=1|jgi:hypothetical protein
MIHEYNGNVGVARQGDVLIFKLPDSIKVNKTGEISPRDGKLILLEGEMTGHHHSVDVMDRPIAALAQKTNKMVEDLLNKASNVTAAVVKMYSDKGVVDQLVAKKILTRTDLYIGTMVVEGGGDVGVVVQHQEHDGIRLKEGCYYVGRQIESAGAEERLVRD